MKIKKIINISCFCIMLICGVAITYLNFRSSDKGLGNAGYSVYSQSVADEAAKLTEGITDPLEKANVLAEYISKNYKYEKNRNFFNNLFYEGENEVTLKDKRGVCRNFAGLYAAMCRSQGIRCYIVNADVNGRDTQHTWNRLYIEGKWYNIDLTENVIYYSMNKDIKPLIEIPDLETPRENYTITSIL